MKTILNYFTFAALMFSCYCVKKYSQLAQIPHAKPRAMHLIGQFSSGQEVLDMPLQMKLSINDHFVQGTYKPADAEIEVELVGAMNNDNELILVETSAGKTTGTFKGTLVSRSNKLMRLSGIWTKVNSTYLHPFLLDEVRQ
ncbi:hypothetical protein [Dyadobacter sp. CY323]|uniref:hypothetical protein n=1 Tax=Dyadobacter sp. CY323 TaxID=2907302 RepID=UPI001F1DF19B|nr:hypothetical protein [Dyadobacter sp. CY323]MCE6991480.1 hypothetical protein [Dyadobacter sp. CY323]